MARSNLGSSSSTSCLCPSVIYTMNSSVLQNGAMRLPLRIPCMLALLVVLHFAIPGKAQAVAANSCSLTDVQTAVNNAGRNGSVSVPAGSCSWSSPLNITTGITLTGAGAGSTIITSSGGITLITANPDATAIANSENIKITGFTFDGANSSGILIQIEGANGISGTKPYRNYIIGDNTFRNANPASATGGTVGACIQSLPDSHGQLRGVIYHNTFDRCNILLRVFSEDSTGEWSNTAFNQLAYGTSDSLYFEDNTIQFSSSYNGADPGWIETGQGGRLVARYNNYNFANAATPTEIWDIHGFQNWNGTVNSGQTSTMISEYYGNTLSNAGQYRWANHRGSWALIFDNILTGSGGNVIDLYGVSSPGKCPSDINPTPTNYNPLVNNSYFFNNTKNGTVVNAQLNVDPGCSPDPHENANWWNYNAACTAVSCSAGVGVGQTPPIGTCTTGVGFWVASVPLATTSSSVIQNASLYKCTATNTWQKYYVPYTYPHPLRSSTSGTAPSPPTGLSAVVQ
jgi:hypothetical protein